MSIRTIWIIALALLVLQTWLFCRSSSVSPNDLGTRIVVYSLDVLASIFITCLFAAIPAVLLTFIPFRNRNYWKKLKWILPISIGSISILLIVSLALGRFRQARNIKVSPIKTEESGVGCMVDYDSGDIKSNLFIFLDEPDRLEPVQVIGQSIY